MCRDCLVEFRPDVLTHTSDSGANMLNYKACVKCGTVTLLKIVELTKEIEEDGEDCSEEIRFKHACTTCEHVVAEHFYTYIQDEDEQTYNMDCFLCGHGGSATQFASSFADLNSDPTSPAQNADPLLETKPALNLGAALDGAGMNKLLQANDNYTNNTNGDDADWE